MELSRTFKIINMVLSNNFGTVNSKSGGKMTKHRILSYFSQLNIYKSTRKYEWLIINDKVKPNLSLKPIPWVI